jgi:hypothetical protein
MSPELDEEDRWRGEARQEKGVENEATKAREPEEKRRHEIMKARNGTHQLRCEVLINYCSWGQSGPV